LIAQVAADQSREAARRIPELNAGISASCASGIRNKRDEATVGGNIEVVDVLEGAPGDKGIV
jgi:hypothetical protein